MKLDLVIELAAATQATSASLARLPGLETLIARGDPATAAASTCDACLIAMLGFDPSIGPNAALYALGEGLVAGADYWLRADPVCLAPTTAQLTLSELPEGALTAVEAQALSATLIAHFAANDYVLFTPDPQRWYLRLKDAPELDTLSPAACAGTLQESHLPSGRDSALWKRMITEAQMLLHSHPVNVAREADGKAPANAIWPWGGGRLPTRPDRPRYSSVWSDDLLVRGLARAAGIAVHAMPDNVHAVLANERADGNVLVVLRSPFARVTSALACVEQEWVPALRGALESGQITALTTTLWCGCGPIARNIRRAHLRRWWRRRRALQAHG